MDTNGIRVKDLLNYLPAPLLDQLAQATQVDYQVKKLHGKLLFQLLLYGVLTTTRLSLNVLVAVLDSLCFRTFAGLKPDFQTRRNSLADRLAHVQVAYFEQLLQATTALFRRHFFPTTRSGPTALTALTPPRLAARLSCWRWEWSTASSRKMRANASNKSSSPSVLTG